MAFLAFHGHQDISGMLGRPLSERERKLLYVGVSRIAEEFYRAPESPGDASE